jgi:hypothetical protein
MSETDVPDESQEGVGQQVVDSDGTADQYELYDVADDADYYGTDDDSEVPA